MAGPASRTAFKQGGPRRNGQSRRVGVRAKRTGLTNRLAEFVQSPRAGWGLLVFMLFVLLGGALTIWAREQPMVAVGRVMNDTRLVRVALQLEDAAATEQNRESARQRTPRVYTVDAPVLDEIQASLENLPGTLSSVQSLDQVDPKIRAQFMLNDEMLAALKGETESDGAPSPTWINRVRTFMELLRRRPILDEQTWQRSVFEGRHQVIRLVQANKTSVIVPRGEVLNADDAEKLGDAVRILARDAGLVGPARQAVVNRVTRAPRPTYTYDGATTTADQNSAAENVIAVIKENPPGQVIFRRGEVLTQAGYDLYVAELNHFRSGAESWQLWLRRLSLVASVSAITLAIAGYTALFCPRIRRNPARMAGVAGLLLGTLALACFGTALDPNLAALSVVCPTVFVCAILCIGYDQRMALAFGALHGVLVCIALDQGIGTFALIVAGVGTSVWHLREIRHRNALFKMAVYAAIALALGTALVGFIDRPITPQSLRETLVDSGLAGAGALVVGGTTLFILPSVERLFDVTTGMTLIELRDPKHPLLRELQQRAPGTYNHSLNVAAIAEAAADAIGADSLLTYVGALYHDCGKMNKPEYFVENQYGGPNKHDKLSPAMSLLVIVGHVKDGMELAREFGLPRTIQHFIESHHGTTLVEYFFHRAQQRAQELARQHAEAASREDGEVDDQPQPDPAYVPDEFEYRYPGPKPRTRETAIVMLADAIESATRTLAEPTPSRIDSMVRSLANKRLLDNQFEDCELTLKDLNTIADSISKTVASIYHGRISYKSTAEIATQRA